MGVLLELRLLRAWQEVPQLLLRGGIPRPKSISFLLFALLTLSTMAAVLMVLFSSTMDWSALVPLQALDLLLEDQNFGLCSFLPAEDV